jgi:hypothetical protein
MKEIIEINKRILAEAPEAVPKDFGCIMVTRRDDAAKELAALPVKIRADLVQFLQKLNQTLPDDFGYLINLGHNDPGLMLMYSDGPQAEGNCPVEWDLKRSIFDQLPDIDWDMHRKQVIGMGHFFDDVRQVSKELEPNLPPTSKIQKQFRAEIKAFEAAKRKKNPAKIYALLWRGDEGVSDEALDSMESLERMLCDSMATSYVTLDVIMDGKPLAAKKIDEVKAKVLKSMKEEMPISYAKAVGLFG